MLVAVIALAPILEDEVHPGVGRMLGFVGLAVPAVAVAAASSRVRIRRMAFTLAALCFLMNGVALVATSVPVWLGNVTALAFLAFTTYVMLHAVATSERVGADVIAGALASYVLIGLTWAIAFAIVETHWPGSIRFPPGERAGFSDLLYFSYVSLLTVGYGDITPASGLARTLVVFEGLIGMAFTTVLLAVLVAMRLRDRQAR